MEIILASRNEHKAVEIRSLLGPRFRVRTAAVFPEAPPLAETADSFSGNATEKAVQLAKWLAKQPEAAGAWVVADDSGLEVEALRGLPGIYSARFAAMEKDREAWHNCSDAENNRKLIERLKGVPEKDRMARFCCAIAVTPVLPVAAMNASPVCELDESEFQTRVFVGICEGRIALKGKGNHGFGYDPLFIPVGYDRTFGELGQETKNRISHRAKALAQLKEFLMNPASPTV